jgi:nucleoid DNA-binding protein
LNKAELTEKLIERTGLSSRDARAAIDAVFDPDPAIGLIAAALVA